VNDFDLDANNCDVSGSSDNSISVTVLVISRWPTVYKPCVMKKGRLCFSNCDNKLIIA
jgi:hypothetical protein